MPELLLAVLLLSAALYLVRRELRRETHARDWTDTSPAPASGAPPSDTLPAPEPHPGRGAATLPGPEQATAKAAPTPPIPQPAPLLATNPMPLEWLTTPDIDWPAALTGLHQLHQAGLLRHLAGESDLRSLAKQDGVIEAWAAAQQRPVATRHPWLGPALVQRLGKDEPVDFMRLYLAPGPGRDVYSAALTRWAALTGGALILEDVHEQWEGPDGPVTVTCTLNGRAVRLLPRVQQPWFDMNILAGLNATLDSGSEQFYVWTATPILDHAFVLWLAPAQAALLAEAQGWQFADPPLMRPGELPPMARPAMTLQAALMQPRPLPAANLPTLLQEAGIDPAPLHHLLTAGGRDFYGYTAPPGSAWALWTAFRAAHPQTGYWPLLFDDLAVPTEAVTFHYARATRTPEEILAAAVQRQPDDVGSPMADYLASLIGGLPHRQLGATPVNLLPAPAEAVPKTGHLFLVPAGAPWEVPAMLQLEEVNGFLTAVEQVAFLYHWHLQHGAEPVTLLFAVAEFVVARPPRDPAAALRLILEQDAYCGDLYQMQYGDMLDWAAGLLANPYWRFWWD